MPRLVHIPPIDHLYTIHTVFKSSRAQKIRDRCKPRHFGRASQTRTTCALTLADHTNHGLRHRLAPNEWYPKIYINTANAEKITKGSKCPCGHERIRAKNHCVHQPVKTKYDTASPRSGARSIRIHIVHIINIHISKMWRWHISYF